MPFKITCDTANLENELRDWEKRKLPYATATALTRTAKAVRGLIRTSASRAALAFAWVRK